MYPTFRDFEVRLEQNKDLLREAEYERLIRVAMFQQSNNKKSLPTKVSHWLGTRMVNWGLQLQHRNPIPEPGCNQC